ncbi:threonine aldolase [Lentzea sp. NBRC 105346]|uniref:threonine aldolase family protein n=1 Tax=Lentzea sp. NBRC 105346 TaxID=3032205 RepID=UPI0024A19A0D|nr:beta-eliminating lyase-related protein [Lentzea sp. NBRC 105346]GLZ31227.1 threonine aldolase [Lentzea sp. NBRC 105346]
MNRQLSGVRPTTMREQLADLLTDDKPDRYGEGGPVEELEKRVAELLGTEAALFVPTGTMAQQIALRCWADRTHNDIVAMHPTAHPLLHEDEALTVLAGLRPIRLATDTRLITPEDVHDCPEPFGTLLLEVPQREIGFVLPTWDQLRETVESARERDAVVHLDGARLWESTHGLGHDLREVAGLFDSVYVSFYKSLQGISGAALAGPRDFVDQARVWRHRYGGQLWGQWPAALSALHGIDTVLPRLKTYVEHAKVVAKAMGVAEPHTHQFRLHIPGDPEHINEVKGDFLGKFFPSQVPGVAVTEVTVAEPALEWTHDEVAEAFREFRAKV